MKVDQILSLFYICRRESVRVGLVVDQFGANKVVDLEYVIILLFVSSDSSLELTFH